MGRWVVEATTALACLAEVATILHGLRSCSIIHTYLASTALAVALTLHDVSATPATSGYAHGSRNSHGRGEVGSGGYHGPRMPS